MAGKDSAVTEQVSSEGAVVEHVDRVEVFPATLGEEEEENTGRRGGEGGPAWRVPWKPKEERRGIPGTIPRASCLRSHPWAAAPWLPPHSSPRPTAPHQLSALFRVPSCSPTAEIFRRSPHSLLNTPLHLPVQISKLFRHPLRE